MVNTRTDAELVAAVQNALQTLLPQIRAEIHEEFRTGFGPSGSGGNPPPVTIHTWLERFNKQKPYSFEKATAPAEFKELFFLQFFPRAEQEHLKREYHSILQMDTKTSTEFMQRFLRLAGDDDGAERPDKRQKTDDRHQPTTQQSSHRNHGHNNDRHGSDRGPSKGYSYPVCTTCGRRHPGECHRAAEHRATIDCRSDRVIFSDIHAHEFIYHGSLPGKSMQIISALQARTLLSHGCEGFLVTIHDTTSDVPSIHDQPIVSEFTDVFFPDELLGIPPVHEVEFNIELIPGLLKKEKLYAKFSKCDFWIRIVQFLGHSINSQGLHVDPTKIKAVKNWETPTTPTEVRQFLRLTGYYQRFIEELPCYPLHAYTMPYTIARAICMHDYDMLPPSHRGTMTMTYEAPVSCLFRDESDFSLRPF
nr:putative reverse transcriptase domain-containing protein [Tanacetum cinerariifolium]